MNTFPETPREPTGSWGLTYRKQNQRERMPFSFLSSAIEMAAAFTSVTAYHPFRTVATRLAAGAPVEWQPRGLYRGFVASALGAHQFALTADMYRRLRQSAFHEAGDEPTALQKFMMAGFAGLMTTPTVTPLDMVVVQRQLNQTFDRRCLTLYYRGLVPTALRQVGVGAGMVVLPELLADEVNTSFPSYAAAHSQLVKVTTAASAGCLSALATQFFETARLLMQADVTKQKYHTSWKTFKAVPEQLFSQRGAQMTSVRLVVVVVATVAMNQSRTFYSRLFKGEK